MTQRQCVQCKRVLPANKFPSATLSTEPDNTCFRCITVIARNKRAKALYMRRWRRRNGPRIYRPEKSRP